MINVGARRLSIDVIWVGAAELIALGAQLGIVALLGHALGPAGLGVIGMAWALYAIALPLVQDGPETVGVRALAQAPDDVGAAGRIVAFKLAIALPVVALGIGGALVVFGPAAATGRQVGLQALVLVPIALSYSWALRALERFDLVALTRAGQSVLTLALLAVVLRVWPVPLAAPVVDFTAGALFAIMTVLLARRYLGTPAIAPLGRPATSAIVGGRQHGGGALPLGLAGVAAAVVWTALIPMAALVLPAAEVGQLTAAIRLLLVINTAPQLLLQVLYPRLARGMAGDAAATRRDIWRLMGLTLVVSGAVALAVAALAGPLLAVLFGPGFAEAAPLLRLLAAGIVANALGSVAANGLLAAGRFGIYAAIMVAGAVVLAGGLAIGLALAPRDAPAPIMVAALFALAVAQAVALARLK
jgi:O-antigen/teichoic acid export membrane protein